MKIWLVFRLFFCGFQSSGGDLLGSIHVRFLGELFAQVASIPISPIHHHPGGGGSGGHEEGRARPWDLDGAWWLGGSYLYLCLFLPPKFMDVQW